MTYISKILVLAVIMLQALVLAAFAQDTGTVSNQSWLYGVWGILQPLVSTLALVVGPVIATWISAQVIRLFNVQDLNAQKELEQKIRTALHEAAANAVKYAITLNGITLKPGSGIPEVVIKDAIEYIRSKSPDTAAQAGLDNKGLTDIILSKVPDVMVTVAAATPTVELPVDLSITREPVTTRKSTKAR